MEAIRRAWADLRHDPALPLVYVGAHALLFLGIRALEHALGAAAPDGEFPAWFPAYNLSRQLFVAACVALIQAVVFARLGRAIDRPLWKCADDAEAVRRFFVPWFVLNLFGILLQQLQINAQSAGDEGLYVFAEFTFLMAYVFSIPAGAAVMAHGALDWSRLGEILAPIGRQLRHVLLVFVLMAAGHVLNFVALALVYLASGEGGVDAAIVLPAIAIMPPAFIEALAFAVMWRILMLDRDTALYEDPYDF